MIIRLNNNVEHHRSLLSLLLILYIYLVKYFRMIYFQALKIEE